MNVKELFDVLAKAIREGHGYLPVYGVDGASGVSYEVRAHGNPHTVSSSDDAGPLCELSEGTKYIPLHLGN